MECPNGHKKLEKELFHDVEVDYCPECLGIWFDKDELVYAKDSKDEQLQWVDFDIWRHKEKFQAVSGNRRCPICRIPFVQLQYDNSKVKIDYCKNKQEATQPKHEISIEPIPHLYATRNQAFTYTLPVKGDNLTFTDYTPLFDISLSTGQINFTPQERDAGDHEILIFIKDLYNHQALARFNLTITKNT